MNTSIMSKPLKKANLNESMKTDMTFLSLLDDAEGNCRHD